MKISTKREAHSLVSGLKSYFQEYGYEIKTCQIKEHFAQALGYKSFNGLLSAIPTEIQASEEAEKRLNDLIKAKHGYRVLDDFMAFRLLEVRYQAAYSNMWPINTSPLFPEKIEDNDMYWYLTQEGWLRWDQIKDMSKMKIGLNVYEVMRSHRSHFFGAVTSSTRSLWDAVTERYEFELEADRLVEKYGSGPDTREWSSELKPHGFQNYYS